jgi:hypothetical protein
MSDLYRTSKYINFNTGRVILDPETFSAQVPEPMNLDQKIDFFECRVDVWQLGVAVEMLKQIEAASGDSVWCHAAYGLLSVITSYYEMVGKVLNPDSKKKDTSSKDFNVGFADVFPDFAHRHGVVAVSAYRDLMRNGMYHLGYPKKNFLIHNAPGIPHDLEVHNIGERKDGHLYVGIVYLFNPHRVTRTLVKHFGGFMTRLRADPQLREKFEEFFDDFHVAS